MRTLATRARFPWDEHERREECYPFGQRFWRGEESPSTAPSACFRASARACAPRCPPRLVSAISWVIRRVMKGGRSPASSEQARIGPEAWLPPRVGHGGIPKGRPSQGGPSTAGGQCGLGHGSAPRADGRVRTVLSRVVKGSPTSDIAFRSRDTSASEVARRGRSRGRLWFREKKIESDGIKIKSRRSRRGKQRSRCTRLSQIARMISGRVRADSKSQRDRSRSTGNRRRARESRGVEFDGRETTRRESGGPRIRSRTVQGRSRLRGRSPLRRRTGTRGF